MKWQEKFLKKGKFDFKVGDVVKVSVKVKESGKERIQLFEGTVIRRKGGGLAESFTVRKVSANIGVERGFVLHSPVVDKVDVVKKGEVRKAKLYYLRDKVGKDSRVKEKEEKAKEAIDAPAPAAAAPAAEAVKPEAK